MGVVDVRGDGITSCGGEVWEEHGIEHKGYHSIHNTQYGGWLKVVITMHVRLQRLLF
jgi:hypothetical protein